MAYVYRHIRLDRNEPFYIGVCTKDCSEHKRAFCKHGRNKMWQAIVRQTSYEVEIILDSVSKETAFLKEKEFVSLYGRKDLNTGTLANLSDGGEGQCGFKHTEEHRRKNAEAKRGTKHSRELIERRCAHLKGRIVSAETRAKISKAHKGRVIPQHVRDYLRNLYTGKLQVHTKYDMSPESREKKRLAQIGRKHTEEAKRKIAAAGRLRKGIPKGPQSEETKRKHKEGCKTKKAVLQYSIDHVFIKEYASQREVAMFTGILKESIGRACKKENGICKGFIWKYKEAV